MASSNVMRVRSDGFSKSSAMDLPARAAAVEFGRALDVRGEIEQGEEFVTSDIEILSEIGMRDVVDLRRGVGHEFLFNPMNI